MVWMYHVFFNQSLAKGHLNCFQFLAISNKADMNICGLSILRFNTFFISLETSSLTHELFKCVD